MGRSAAPSFFFWRERERTRAMRLGSGRGGFDADEFVVFVEHEAEAAVNAVGADEFVEDRGGELDGLAVGGAGDDARHFAAVVSSDLVAAEAHADDELGHAKRVVRGACDGKPAVFSGVSESARVRWTLARASWCAADRSGRRRGCSAIAARRVAGGRGRG